MNFLRSIHDVTNPISRPSSSYVNKSQNETLNTISYSVIQFLLRVIGSNAALPTITKQGRVAVWVEQGPILARFATAKRFYVPGRCRRGVRRQW